MKNDLNDLKKVTADLMNGKQPVVSKDGEGIAQSVYEDLEENPSIMISAPNRETKEFIMTLQDHEKILIQKHLKDIAVEGKTLPMN